MDWFTTTHHEIDTQLYKSLLALVSNRSFVTGISPSELKIGTVIPIFKSGDMMISNYMPVFLLHLL